MVDNGYIKGLNRDTALSFYGRNSYFSLKNMKVISQDEMNTGMLESEEGNELLFKIPSVPDVYQVNFTGASSYDVTIIQGANIELIVASSLNELLDLVRANTDLTGIRAWVDGQSIFIYTSSTSPIAVTSTNGNESTYMTGSDPHIVGITRLNQWFVVFTTDSEAEDSSGSDCQIWKFRYEDDNQDAIEGVNGFKELSLSDHLIYYNKLGYSSHNYIRDCVSRYESDQTGRVYYTDFFNEISAFNIFDDKLYTYPPSFFRQKPEVVFSKPVVAKIDNGGSLPYGSYIQYFYKLKTTSGVETPFSPGSNLIMLNEELTNDPTLNSYNIDPVAGGVGNNKRLTVEIKSLPNTFDIIELYGVVWTNLDAPSVFKIEESIQDISSTTYTYVHDGTEDEIDISLSEFNTVDIPIVAKTIDDKFNRLFAANIKEKTFDIDFDARAYRFKADGTCDLLSSNLAETITIQTPNPDYSSIPEDFDCVNPTNLEFNPDYVSYRYQKSNMQVFKSDGTTIGGEGENVSYRFVTEDMAGASGLHRLHNNDNIPYNQSGTRYLNGASVNLGETYSDGTNVEYNVSDDFMYSKGSMNRAIYTGYSRGEVYRFGVVFYNKQGIPSFVNWIGDIKFPDPTLSDTDYNIGTAPDPEKNGYDIVETGQNQTTITTTPREDLNDTFSNVKSLGIEFTIDTSSIQSEISGYKIVRVERKYEDRSRLGTGIIWQFTKPDAYRNLETFPFVASLPTETDSYTNVWNRNVDYQNEVVPTSTNLASGTKNSATGWESIDDAMNLFGTNYGKDTGNSGVFCLMDEPTVSNVSNLGDGGAPENTYWMKVRAKNLFISPEVDFYGQTSYKYQDGSDYIKEYGYYSYIDEAYHDSRRDLELNDSNVKKQNVGFVFRAKQFSAIQHPIWSAPQTIGSLSSEADYFKINDSLETKIGQPFNRSNATPVAPLGETIFDDILIDDVTEGTSTTDNGWVINATYGFKGGGNSHSVPFGLGARNRLISLELNDDPNDLYTGGSNMNWYVYAQAHGGGRYRQPAVKIVDENDNIYAGGVSTVYTSSIGKMKSKRAYMKEVAYCRDLANQYGGNSYLDRQKNEYIDTGNYQAVVTGVTSYTNKVFGGDTYVNVYDKKIIGQNWDNWQNDLGNTLVYRDAESQDNVSRMSISVMIPCESTVNIAYRDRSYWGNTERGSICDLSGTSSGDLSSIYPRGTIIDRYLQENNVQSIFFAKDILNQILDVDNYPNRIRYSEFKNDNELDDHWRVFKPANFKDIDGDKGEINKIAEFKNQMYFFQDRGTGYQSIQERSMITDGTGAQLTLGVGDILGQHQYLSDSNGTKHQESVVRTNQALYYYDSVHKSVNIITGENLSSAKGLNKFFVENVSDDLLDDDIIFKHNLPTGVSSCYDVNNERVIFTLMGARTIKAIKSNEDYTLNVGDVILYADGYYEVLVQGVYGVSGFDPNNFRAISSLEAQNLTVTYNEKLQAFESFPSYYPNKYFVMDRRMTSVNQSNTREIWQHGKIENTTHSTTMSDIPYSNYYGVQYRNELISVVNPSPKFNSIFNNLQYYSDVERQGSSVSNVVDAAVDTIHVWNEYQNSNETALTVGDNISRRFRKWRVTIPRDILNTGDIAKPRMRSKSIFLKLAYTPGDVKWQLEGITTKFTPADQY